MSCIKVVENNPTYAALAALCFRLQEDKIKIWYNICVISDNSKYPQFQEVLGFFSNLRGVINLICSLKSRQNY